MRKYIIALSLSAAVVAGPAIAAVAPAGATPPNPDHKVTLCHRTGSATNPYIVITTDIASDGYVKGGHTGHDQIGNGLGGDIIPAYEYVAKNGDVFDFPGKNLDTIIGGATGAEILANGCVIPGGETSPPPVPPVINPAADIHTRCSGHQTTAIVVLDNSASTDGTEEGGTAQFIILVNGVQVGDVVNVSAGDTSSVDLVLSQDAPAIVRDTVTVLDGRNQNVLATDTVTVSCGSHGGGHHGGHKPPTPPPPSKHVLFCVANPTAPACVHTQSAFTGLSSKAVPYAAASGALLLVGLSALGLARKRSAKL
jgi:hypothetical protein